MWPDSRDVSDAGGTRVFGHIMLPGLEPVQQGGIGLPARFSRNPLVCGVRHYALFQSGLLGTESNLGVAIGGFQACVAEPSANDVHLDTSFEKMHGGCGSHPGQTFENLIEQAVEGCPKRGG